MRGWKEHSIQLQNMTARRCKTCHGRACGSQPRNDKFNCPDFGVRNECNSTPSCQCQYDWDYKSKVSSASELGEEYWDEFYRRFSVWQADANKRGQNVIQAQTNSRSRINKEKLYSSPQPFTCQRTEKETTQEWAVKQAKQIWIDVDVLMRSLDKQFVKQLQFSTRRVTYF